MRDSVTYDRSALQPSIVHIGVGGFHRSHLATYVDDLAKSGNVEWGIVGSGVLPGDATMAETMKQQDCLYTLISRGPTKTDVSVIGSIISYIHASPDASDLIKQIAAATTHIVSLTVTEGGYPIDDADGSYLSTSSNAGPDSTFGIVARALDLRRENDGGPITIISCDNIMSNGLAAKRSTLGEAERIGPDLVTWIKESVSFPNSMVDRITPATTDEDRQWLADNHNISDGWPVVAEPFRQWVVEDRFAGTRLPLEDIDVIVTSDVEPYEHMKLRLLNAGHSCLAYLAALVGVELVDEAMADDHLARFVRAFLEQEAKPVLPAVAGIDIDDYIDSLIERFSNPSVGDQIARLCIDGTAKFPKFLIPTIEAQIAAQGPLKLSALALAGWCDYLNGVDHQGETIALASDPGLGVAVPLAKESLGSPAAFLKLTSVFGPALTDSELFVEAFVEGLTMLRSEGLRPTIEALL